MKNQHRDTQQLAVLVYVHAMKKQIEEKIKSKYLKRIEHLIGANNELVEELERKETKTKKKTPTLVDGTYYKL